MGLVRYDQPGAIAVVTLDDPASRNCLTGNSIIGELLAICARVTQDMSVRVVVLTASGSAFSSGGNLDVMRGQTRAASEAVAVQDSYRHGIQALALAMYHLEVPVIAAVNGPAIGAGFDLACMCDVRVASEKAKFASSFVRLGLVPGDGGAWFLPRLIGRERASLMALTGMTIDAAKALEFQLVSKVVAQESLMDEALRIAGEIAANPPQALRLTKKLLRMGDDTGLRATLDLSAGYQALLHHSAEHEERLVAHQKALAARNA